MIDTANFKRALRGGGATLVLALAAMPTGLQAQATTTTQTTPPSAEAPAASDGTTAPTQTAENEIIVTGSRIARPDLAAAVPVTVVGAQRIQQVAAANVQDVLATLPAVGQNFSRTSSNFSNTGNGEATINLRNLGSARTLVLIDGRRLAGVPGSSAVDVNNIPTDLIDNVQVVTGGASAVYGSEAIAGVVNFVLKDKFEGVTVRAQSTISGRGDAPRQYVSVTAGQGFFDGRAHIVGNFSYDNDHGLRSRNRSYSATDVPNRSSYAQQGLFDVSNPDQTQFSAASGRTFTFNPDNTVKPYQGANIDGYNRNGDRYLSVPVERYQGTLLGNFEFSDAATLYAEGEYDRVNSNAGLEPSAIGNSGPGAALSFDTSPYPGIPITSPYVPAAIRDAAIANGVDVIQFRRRSNDIFSRSNTDHRDYYRGVVGLRGNISPKFSYDVYYEHSQGRDHTFSQAIYTPNYGAALDNEIGPDGQVRCSDPAARAAGCVPINIFGYNTVGRGSAAAQFLQTYTGPDQDLTLIDGNTVSVKNGQRVLFDYLAKNRQDVVSGNIHGDLFSLWGSPVAIAVGGEYRREKSSEVYDPFTQAGLSSGNQITNTRGKFNVKEVFGELIAPVVEDRPFAKYLGLEGAFRYADYSTVGGVTSWKAGGRYAPTSDIAFRVIYSRATRAPNISELFSSVSQTFPAVNDPCDQGQGNGDGADLVALPAGCAAIPGIANTVATRGAFAYSTAQIQTIDGLIGGNPNLKEETANTITAGAVVTPSFFKRFSLTVDYYHIKVKNAIGIVGQQDSLDQCYATGNPFFCNNIVRDANGFVTRVNAINLNTGAYLVSGIDTEARYSIPFEYFGGSKFDIDILWNHRFRQQQTSFPGATPTKELGQADCYSCGRLGSGFRNHVVGNFTFGTPNFQFYYRIDYLSPLVDNLSDGADAIHIPHFVYHNIQAKFLVGGKRGLEFYAGVNNLTDKQPPRFGDTNQVTWPGTQTVADTYDLYGRMFVAGVTFKF